MTTKTFHIPTWTLGDKLHKARKDAGLQTSDMAALLKCSRNTITNWEAGRTAPNPATITLWAQITGVPPAWLSDEHAEVPADRATEITAGFTRERLPGADVRSSRRPAA